MKISLSFFKVVPEQWLNTFLETCKSKNHQKLIDFMETFMLEAYAVSQVFEQLNELIVASNEFNEQQKSVILDKLGVSSYSTKILVFNKLFLYRQLRTDCRKAHLNFYNCQI